MERADHLDQRAGLERRARGRHFACQTSCGCAHELDDMMPFSSKTTIAYFSMEIALDKAIPTYSGGLGVLAGDTLRSAADLSVPVVGLTLLHRKGYFEQHIDEQGNQTESASEWSPEDTLEPVDVRTSVVIEGRSVAIRAWKYPVRGVTGHEVPVYLLD